MQCCIMMGRVVADPVRRLTASGVPVASWRLAVDRDRSGADGQRAADYIDCIAWRGLADVVSKWWRKGKPMLVSGRMQSRSYTDRDGVRRRAVELVLMGCTLFRAMAAAARCSRLTCRHVRRLPTRCRGWIRLSPSACSVCVLRGGCVSARDG